MPVIRAFGRWLRRHSTDDRSDYSRYADGSDAQRSDFVPSRDAVRFLVVILVAILGFVPVLVLGAAYEVVRRFGRRTSA